MFCKYCGNELTEDARFCPKCGKINENKPEEIDYFDDFNGAELATQEDVANVENPERDSRGGEILKFAILGLAFGVTGTFSILGLILSYIAKRKLKRYLNDYGKTQGRASVGKGLSIAGIIVSWVMLALVLIYLVTLIAPAGTTIGGVFNDIYNYIISVIK